MERKNDDFILTVWSFKQIEAVLSRTGDKKMAETRACLEGKATIIKTRL